MSVLCAQCLLAVMQVATGHAPRRPTTCRVARWSRDTFQEIDQTLLLSVVQFEVLFKPHKFLLLPKFKFMLLVSFCWSRVMPCPEPMG